MALDIDATLAEMLEAIRGVAGGQRQQPGDAVRRALEREKAFLQRLADARLAGEINDDILAAQLHDERDTLAGALRTCQSIAPRLAQDAANAAIDVFENAVGAACRKHAAGSGRRAAAARRPKKPTIAGRRLNARPDTVDFRDLVYVPTLIEVGTEIPLERFRRHKVPVLDQGEEGACTGFGLATVAHYLLRTRKVRRDSTQISPRMFYAMARRYDEWPGEAYEGSSCRGAMKGWHKHGVCAGALWRHDPESPDFSLTEQRSRDAQSRPLGAYFRVNHRDLVAMHTAISEVGVLYASANVHSGWDDVGANGIIRYGDKSRMLGGHAFAIVGYDRKGFWIQNSWSASWGKGGFGHISYADWLKNGSDVWVARLGVPVELAAREASTSAAFTTSARARAYAYDEIRPHVISLGNDGQLRNNGNLATPPEQVRRILHDDFARITKGWNKRRILLYAHGGLVSEDSAVQRVSEYRKAMLEAEVYPLAFVWNSDYWSTLTNILREALRLRRPEGVLDKAEDFMLDRLDDAIEPLARKLTGKAAWDEMKENATRATESPSGGARLVANQLAALAKADPGIEIHLVGHSAGSILHAPLLRLLTDPAAAGGHDLTLATCTLWAPACTMLLFESAYLPAIQNKRIRDFALYTLTDKAEQDDHCAWIYNKSLLYLVSHAFEKRARVPIFRPEGEAILGMAKFIDQHAALQALLKQKRIHWAQSPNAIPVGEIGAARATEHGGFDDDKATVQSTLLRVLGAAAAKAPMAELSFKAGMSRMQSFRNGLNNSTRVA